MENQNLTPALIDEWPYADIVARFNNGDHTWRETSERIYWDQLGCLPPARHKDGAFAVGECYTHDDEGHAIFAVFTVVDGRFFCKLDRIRDFDPLRFEREIIAQFHVGQQVFICAGCHQEKEVDELAIAKGSDLFCEDCTVDQLSASVSTFCPDCGTPKALGHRANCALA